MPKQKPETNEEIYQHNRKTLFLIPLWVGIGLLFTGIGALPAIVLLFIALVNYMRMKNSCESCMAWNSMVKTDSQLLASQAATIRKTVKEREREKLSGFDNYGIYHEFGTLERERTRNVDVPVERRTHLVSYQCSCCGYTKDKTVNTTREI
ncbi:MAG: hypothetical protein LBB75_07960 [Oscillospiraceae bacterium]|nr:hypothetical protein [Oscillospiraceae bacterium]